MIVLQSNDTGGLNTNKYKTTTLRLLFVEYNENHLCFFPFLFTIIKWVWPFHTHLLNLTLKKTQSDFQHRNKIKMQIIASYPMKGKLVKKME